MLYFIYRNTHYLIGGVRMKKLISVFLCAVLIVSVFSANAFAASPDTFHTDSLSCHTTEVAPCSRVPIKQYLQKLPKWGRFGVTSVTPFLLLPVHPEGCTPAHRT